MISSDLFVIQKYLIHFYSFFPPPTPSIRLPRHQALAQRVWALGCVSGGSTSPASGSGLLLPPCTPARLERLGRGFLCLCQVGPGTSVTGCHRVLWFCQNSLLAVVSGLSHFLLLSALAWRKVQVFLVQRRKSLSRNIHWLRAKLLCLLVCAVDARRSNTTSSESW